MASSTASTTTPRHAFERRVDDVKPLKTDINDLILDYLITEGYPSAAAKFSKEANLSIGAQDEEESVKARKEIQAYIYGGNIEEAISQLNELEPQVLDKDPSLHFALLRLQLVELIRKCNSESNPDITPALTFATSQLAPRAPTNPEFLEDLERTMALLVFPADSLEPNLAALLQPGLRQTVADNVNKAILASRGRRRDAKIRSLVRLRAWAESSAREIKKDYPARIELGLDGEDQGEPMIT